MTVAELIKELEKAKPYLEVRVWDTHRQSFTDRFHVQSATYDDELLVTPADAKLSNQPLPSWGQLALEQSDRDDRFPPSP